MEVQSTCIWCKKNCSISASLLYLNKRLFTMTTLEDWKGLFNPRPGTLEKPWLTVSATGHLGRSLGHSHVARVYRCPLCAAALWSVTALNYSIVRRSSRLGVKLFAKPFEVLIPLSGARAKNLGEDNGKWNQEGSLWQLSTRAIRRKLEEDKESRSQSAHRTGGVTVSSLFGVYTPQATIDCWEGGNGGYLFKVSDNMGDNGEQEADERGCSGGGDGPRGQRKAGRYEEYGRRRTKENRGRSAVVSRIKWHAVSCGRYN